VKYPVLMLSDIHAHSWSQFSTVNADGVNSRLAIMLRELERAFDELRKAGGDTAIIAGDLFHVRGSIDPEVFNPVNSLFARQCAIGMKILAIPGNHDLKGRETTEIGNAMQSLNSIDGFTVITEPAIIDDFAFIPWESTNDGLRARVEKLQSLYSTIIPRLNLIMHAGIDGVLIGVPDHGLTAPEIAGWGFKRVLSGHYHHHKSFEDDKVISIGATTHQTWSDLDTKAGFLLVGETGFEYRASQAPAFVEIDSETDPDEIPLIVDGNYVRIRGLKLTDAGVNEMRAELMDMGARGTSFQTARETVSTRGTSAPAKALSLEASIDSYIAKQSFDDPALITAMCADILTAVRAPAI
jgi:DNA repair exonuclease SbcCD nuclease subunit